MMETLDNPSTMDSKSKLTLANYIKGGIGNQLFQHVFGKSLAKKLGADLQSDVSFFGADPYNNQSVMRVIAPELQTTEVAKLIGPGSYMLRDGVLSSIDDQISLPADAKVLALDGYWQSERLLDRAVVSETYGAIAQQLREVGQSDIARDIVSHEDAVAIHLRRRDYAHMGLCEASYYVGAIEFVLKRFPDAKLYVFSDEPNYAQQLLGARYPGLTMVSSGNDLADLYLMSLCKHFVIANSTFSWWAAYFAESKGGVIICPKEWVTLPGATASPCPDRWIKIPNAVRALSVDQAASALVEKQIQMTIFDEAIRNWFGDRGDQTLRVNFDNLNADSVVLDLGGYLGDWTHEIYSRYQSKVYTFEPIKGFADKISQRFAGIDAVKVCNFGLGPVNEQLELALSADGTGAFKTSTNTEVVELKEINAFLDEAGIQTIDLLKINIEGAEFDLLNHIVDTGLIKRIKKIQVQFHDFVPDAIRRREALVKKLSLSHRRNWNYYFVWEEWQLA